MKFAHRLKELRKKHKLTQVQFAKLFDISKATIAMWELGKRHPDYDTLIKIAKTFNTSIDYLLGVSDHKVHYTNDIMRWLDELQKVGIDLADIEEMSEEQKKALLLVFKGFKKQE